MNDVGTRDSKHDRSEDMGSDGPLEGVETDIAEKPDTPQSLPKKRKFRSGTVVQDSDEELSDSQEAIEDSSSEEEEETPRRKSQRRRTMFDDMRATGATTKFPERDSASESELSSEPSPPPIRTGLRNTIHPKAKSPSVDNEDGDDSDSSGLSSVSPTSPEPPTEDLRELRARHAHLVPCTCEGWCDCQARNPLTEEGVHIRIPHLSEWALSTWSQQAPTSGIRGTLASEEADEAGKEMKQEVQVKIEEED